MAPYSFSYFSLRNGLALIALWLDDSGLSVREVPLPEPAADEGLVRVRLAGVCATDIEITRGYMGFRGILGHEFAGELVGPAGHPILGRRVVGEINCGCGACPRCAAGLERHCPERTVLGILGRPGAFAEYLTLPSRNLHTVPEGVDDEAAVFCEPLTACFEVLEQRPDLAGGDVLVVGDGRLGLLQAQVLSAAGARAAVLGRHPRKLAILEGLGIAAARRHRCHRLQGGLRAGPFPDGRTGDAGAEKHDCRSLADSACPSGDRRDFGDWLAVRTLPPGAFGPGRAIGPDRPLAGRLPSPRRWRPSP
ncbi:MAG: alcohol dehydrogenase catalytic domain-containing protein [Nitrospinota bacterium]